jgi:hypothetical protein
MACLSGLSEGRKAMRHRTVWTSVALVALVVAAILAGAGGASAGNGDAWLTTRTAAARVLPIRFKDVASVSCAPDRASATQISGTTRYWQRFWCSGRTYDRIDFRLRFKAVGQCGSCWTITNLTGLGAAHLRIRHAYAANTSPKNTDPSSGSSGSCGTGYYTNSRGHCVPSPSTDPTLTQDGPTAICGDGSYSYSESASGTCSHHGGVAEWVNHP